MSTTYASNKIAFFPLWRQPRLSRYPKPKISLTLITSAQYPFFVFWLTPWDAYPKTSNTVHRRPQPFFFLSFFFFFSLLLFWFSSTAFLPQALIRVYDTWLTAINQTQLTGAVFLNLKKKKAFDGVNHTIYSINYQFICRIHQQLCVIFLQTITRFTHVGQMWNQSSVVFKRV